MIKRNAFAALAITATMVAGLHIGHAQPGDAVGQLPVLPALPGEVPASGGPGAIPSAVPPTAGLPAVDPMPALPGTLPSAVPPTAGMPPVLPGLPPVNGTVPALPVIPGAPPVLPGLPGAPVSPFGTTGAPTDEAIPTPPPLGAMDFGASPGSLADTTSTVANAAAPSQLYEFLFIEDPDYGVVRQKFEAGVAKNLKQQEINRLLDLRRAGQLPGGGVDIPGVTPLGDPALGGLGGGDPMLGMDGLAGIGGVLNAGLTNESAVRAAAEWDFYYQQLEMYDLYIRQKLIPDAEDLPTLEYTAANALQERQDLFESYQEAAIQQNNTDYNANKEFYERLQKREDRRQAYINWTRLVQRQVTEWSEVWAREVFGTRWADGEVVRVDDWYYGTDFNSAQPVLVAIDDREYVISRQPLRNLQDGQLNVISSNMTPYDIIDSNGYLKNPVMETLRGTLVIPPAPPVYSTNAPTGTIEIFDGSLTE